MLDTIVNKKKQLRFVNLNEGRIFFFSLSKYAAIDKQTSRYDKWNNNSETDGKLHMLESMNRHSKFTGHSS